MNADLHNVIEEALRYASPLPVPLTEPACQGSRPLPTPNATHGTTGSVTTPMGKYRKVNKPMSSSRIPTGPVPVRTSAQNFHQKNAYLPSTSFENVYSSPSTQPSFNKHSHHTESAVSGVNSEIQTKLLEKIRDRTQNNTPLTAQEEKYVAVPVRNVDYIEDDLNDTNPPDFGVNSPSNDDYDNSMRAESPDDISRLLDHQHKCRQVIQIINNAQSIELHVYDNHGKLQNIANVAIDQAGSVTIPSQKIAAQSKRQPRGNQSGCQLGGNQSISNRHHIVDTSVATRDQLFHPAQRIPHISSSKSIASYTENISHIIHMPESNNGKTIGHSSEIPCHNSASHCETFPQDICNVIDGPRCVNNLKTLDHGSSDAVDVSASNVDCLNPATTYRDDSDISDISRSINMKHLDHSCTAHACGSSISNTSTGNRPLIDAVNLSKSGGEMLDVVITSDSGFNTRGSDSCSQDITMQVSDVPSVPGVAHSDLEPADSNLSHEITLKASDVPRISVHVGELPVPVVGEMQVEPVNAQEQTYLSSLFKEDTEMETLENKVAETDYTITIQPKVKRRRNRTKNPGPPPEVILPPCKVCDDKSSGFHYGANTCEACKGFFRRTLKKHEVDYRCKCTPQEHEKWEKGPCKNGCPSCRYERCLDVGMSKNAIKIGRYTINHKTKNIKEVKSLQTQVGKADTAVNFTDMVAVQNLIEAALAEAVCQTSPETESDCDKDSVAERSSTPQSSAGGISSSATDPMSASSAEPMDLSSKSSSNPPSVSHLEPMDLSTDSPVNPATPDSPRYTGNHRYTDSMPGYLQAGITLKEIDSIVKILTESHRCTQLVEEIPLEKVRQRHTEYLEQYKLKTQLFGEMKVLTHAEFAEIYKATGLDVDGRIEDANIALSFMEKKIAVVVAFGKSIPGFKKLCLDDQASLIKASRIDNTIIAGYRQLSRNIDLERRILITPWGKECHFNEVGAFVPLEFIKERYQFANKLKALDLTQQEEAVMRAILVLSTDRCVLKEPAKAEAIQEKLIFCLQHMLNVRHGGPEKLFYRIFGLIIDLRDLAEHEHHFTKGFMFEPVLTKTMNNFALFREFITST